MLLGCSDASLNANGGEPLLEGGATMVPPTDGGSGGNDVQAGAPTWSNIYATVFDPNLASGFGCGQSGCHGAGGLNTWACGSGNTSSSCYSGVVPTIVPMGGASDPTTTALYQALQRSECKSMACGSMLCCNMPLGGPPLTQGQIDLIKAWIHAGAPNN